MSITVPASKHGSRPRTATGAVGGLRRGCRVLGVGLSLPSTGLSDGHWAMTVRSSGRRKPSVVERDQRLVDIVEQISPHLAGVALAVIEGPSLKSGGSPWDRAGLWWTVTHHVLSTDTPLAVVPPSCRAKYATGDGEATRDAVLAATRRRYSESFVDSHDAANALILAAMGMDWLGQPLAGVPVNHRRALSGVEWPRLASPVDQR